MVMRQMRASAKWIMGIVALSFVGWMVFDVGMDITGAGGGGAGASDIVLRVNGEKVPYQNFLIAVRNAQESQRQQTGSAPVTLEDQRRLEDAVIDNFIEEIILQQAFASRGIEVSDEEIRSAAQTSPPPEIRNAIDFQTDGVFDLQKYQRFLAAGADPNFLFALEQRYRTEIPRIKLYEQLSADVYAPSTRLWNMYRDQNDSAMVVFTTVNPAIAIPDSAIAVTDDEIRSYYDDHEDDYQNPAAAFVSYISIPKQTNASDSTGSRELARDFYEQLVEDPEAFETIVARESADSASRFRGGGLGVVTRATSFHEDFEAAALALQPGEISEPVETPFGIHIIRLDSVMGEQYASSHILVGWELRNDHLRVVEDLADSLDLFGAEQTDPEVLDDVAERIGLTVQTAPELPESTSLRIGIERVPDVGIWSFEARQGEMSQVIETANAFYLFRLDSLTDARSLEFEEVETSVRAQVVREKKNEAALEIANRIAESATESGSLTAAAEDNGMRSDSIGPFTRTNPGFQLSGAPEVIGAAFGQPLGSTAPPIATDNGTIYVVQTVGLIPADTSAFALQIQNQRRTVMAQLKDARFRVFLAGLRDGANVIDRRRQIEQALRDLAENDLLGGLQGRGF